jgi:uracil-DNA glycosylase family 4
LTTDEIHEKYLQKAISEINELAHEVAQAAGELRVPVVGTGHPLADIMLVKYRPRATEAQEGVAFFGRSGEAIKKSLTRLRVDALAVYGTNCLKFAEGEEDECRPWLRREFHIVQPKLVVPMGEEALGFVNSLELPLSRPLEARVGELQTFTPTIEGFFTPDIDESLDEQAAKTRFWNAFKLIGPWWAELPPY